MEQYENDRDVAAVVNIITGHKFFRRDRSVDLDAFYESGKKHADILRPYLSKDSRVLEYGGGIGRVGLYLVPHCRSLVSVDINPQMKRYGREFLPDIEFLNLDELLKAGEFDICYSLAVFFHLKPKQQEEALKYIHACLRPCGFALIDLFLGPRDKRKRWGSTMFISNRSRFLKECEKYFSVEAISLFNDGLLLRKASR